MILDDYLMNDTISEDDLLDLVESKIPNLYFMAPVINLSNGGVFDDRKYFELFSKVLILRGEEKLSDLYPALFLWLKDLSYPGALQMREFLIRSDKRSFMKGIYGSIILAHDDQNEEWLSNLLATLSERDNGPIGDLCEYMIDTEDYENDYNTLIDLIEKDQDIQDYEEEIY